MSPSSPVWSSEDTGWDDEFALSAEFDQTGSAEFDQTGTMGDFLCVWKVARQVQCVPMVSLWYLTIWREILSAETEQDKLR